MALIGSSHFCRLKAVEGVKLNFSTPGAKLKESLEGPRLKKITTALRRNPVNSIIIHLGENDINGIIGSLRLTEGQSEEISNTRAQSAAEHLILLMMTLLRKLRILLR